MFRLRGSIAVVLCLAGPVSACDLALVLAVDISGSVDRQEFRIQMDGLAAGLRDPVVSEALVRSEAAVSLVQWSGSSRQVVSIPWRRIANFDDVERLAGDIAEAQREWRNFSTAIGDALNFALPLFDGTQDCGRRVIDVSGDGSNNEGREPSDMRAAVRAAGATVNALVIEGAEPDLTEYFWENVIAGEGAFVVTANSFDEFPERMRQKLRRETAKVLSGMAESPGPVRTTWRDRWNFRKVFSELR